MEENAKIKQLRAESLRRLLNEPGRAVDKTPFWENMINKCPLCTPFVIRMLMRWAGIKIGRNSKLHGRVRVKLRGKPENIIIGNDVVLGNNVDLRNRENGCIVLHDKVCLDDNVRIVAARNGKVEINTGTEIGEHTIINSGGAVYIGRFCMIAKSVSINSSSHGTAKSQFVKNQPHEHGTVHIGDDVWMGGSVSVVMNTRIGEGVVIGANSMVRGEIPNYAVCVGTPAEIIRFRD
jgi:acetyltransferase-like isoleucine patch superfamily enzyme